MRPRSTRRPASLGRGVAVAVLTALFVAVGLSQAEARRLALVVGNADYASVPKLRNAAEDARDVAAALTRLGFEVTLLTDVKAADLSARVDAFSAEAQTAESTVFFYSGHAFQMNGVNYLVPVDAVLQSREAIRTETWNLDSIVARLQDRKRQTLVFLDACRNDPVPQSVRGSGAADGLARMQTGVGTFVAFATEPGAVTYDGAGDAPNSPFTTSLLTHIETPGLSISDMMIKVRNEVAETTLGRQTPWDQSSLREQFYFQAATEAKQELSEADYELLAQLSPEDRAKFLELLRESGFSEESLQLADDAITVASYNLEVAAEVEVTIGAAPAPGAGVVQDVLPEIDVSELELIGGGTTIGVATKAGSAFDIAALPPQPEALPPAEAAPEADAPTAITPPAEPAVIAEAPVESAPEAEIAEAPAETAPAAGDTVIADAPAETAPAAAVSVAEAPDVAEVPAAETTDIATAPAETAEIAVAPAGNPPAAAPDIVIASIQETTVEVLPQAEGPAILGLVDGSPPIRLAALTWETRGIEGLGAVSDKGLARLTGSEVSPDSEVNRAFLAAIDPNLLTGEAVVIDTANLAREAQSELARLGCYRMAVDGSWGRGSRTALTSYFLAKRSVPDTLEPTAALVEQLRREGQVVCQVQVARAKVVPGKTKAILPQKAAVKAQAETVKVKPSAGRKAVTVDKAKKNISKNLTGMGFN